MKSLLLQIVLVSSIGIAVWGAIIITPIVAFCRARKNKTRFWEELSEAIDF